MDLQAFKTKNAFSSEFSKAPLAATSVFKLTAYSMSSFRFTRKN